MGVVVISAVRSSPDTVRNPNPRPGETGVCFSHALNRSWQVIRSWSSANAQRCLPRSPRAGTPRKRPNAGLAYRIDPFSTIRIPIGEFSVSWRYFIILSLNAFSASLRALILTAVQLIVLSSIRLHDRFTQQAVPFFVLSRV